MNSRFGPVGGSKVGSRQPLQFDSVRVLDGLWADWHERNRTVTIPHGMRALESYGNLDNFRNLAGETDVPWRGQLFADSDVYKMLEAVAWELGRADDADMRSFFDSTVDLLGRAQLADGYLDTAYQGANRPEPWSNFEHGHELYVLGHLIQAAVAANRAIGDDRLLTIACRFADLVDDLFGGADRTEYCGHPLIEMALVELTRETGNARYIELAESFIRRRGSGFIDASRFGAVYYQDDASVLDTTTMRGHAVRALYLNSGVTDLVLERGDAELLQAMQVQWDDLVAHRMHITGGTGSRHQDEAYGTAFELPADRAYAETCAGIALFGWAWRMYLATGKASYLDTGELALYNVVLSGISEAGTEFTYSNPLQRRPNHVASREEEASKRLPWFDCACCPPNLMRTFGSLEHYVAAVSGETLEIANYGNVSIALGDAEVEIATNYPAEGRIEVRVRGDVEGHTIAFRVPEWVAGDSVALELDGVALVAPIVDGWCRPSLVLADGAVLVLELPIETRVKFPNRRADALRGTLAVTRGPIVYCAEQADNNTDIDLSEVSEVSEVKVTERGGAYLGLGPAMSVRVRAAVEEPNAPLYSQTAPIPATGDLHDLQLRPYASWGANPTGSMRVWLPVAPTSNPN